MRFQERFVEVVGWAEYDLRHYDTYRFFLWQRNGWRGAHHFFPRNRDGEVEERVRVPLELLPLEKAFARYQEVRGSTLEGTLLTLWRPHTRGVAIGFLLSLDPGWDLGMTQTSPEWLLREKPEAVIETDWVRLLKA